MTYDYSSDTHTGQWNGNTVVVDAGVFHKALKQLQLAGRPYREAFILCDIQGRSVPEAAMLLGVQPSAVTSRLERARRQLSEVTRGLCEQ